MLGTVPPNVSGVNFVTETLNVSAVPVGLDNVIVTDVGWKRCCDCQSYFV